MYGKTVQLTLYFREKVEKLSFFFGKLKIPYVQFREFKKKIFLILAEVNSNVKAIKQFSSLLSLDMRRKF